MAIKLHEDSQTDFSNGASLGSVINKRLEEGRGGKVCCRLAGHLGVKHDSNAFFYFHLLPLSRASVFYRPDGLVVLKKKIVLCFSEIAHLLLPRPKRKGKTHTMKTKRGKISQALC